MDILMLEKSLTIYLKYLCMAVVNSWIDLFSEKLLTNETSILVAKIKYDQHSKNIANWKFDESGNYVKSSRSIG